MSFQRIALLSLACRFPEADDPKALWRNILEGRRSFRPIPESRLPLSDYDVARVGEADSIPRIPAALLIDWSFSRAEFRVPRATFDTTDMAHWLALDVAAKAIAAVGGPDSLPRDRTAVILGNTMTGEFTRSYQIRLRGPYLARKLFATLGSRGIAPADVTDLVSAFLNSVSKDFPEPNEESLAGALANTIAGRIANHFDLHGGAWTVDGACASSLLAVAEGCGKLAAGDLDVAVVGGVDLSLDPFELVGFARAGALALEEMRVFDRRASGFWPGEGCGVAVLATQEAAARIGGNPLGWIRGWGISTDGAGGLTRPTVAGQSLALERAWRRAGRDPAEAGLFEAHGTGTAVGDPTEIRSIAALLGATGRAIPVGSIKGNIGHCKAAAGMAGLIKAASALRDGIVPPHVGCEEPNPVFVETGNRLAPAEAAEWYGEALAGVSGFGFGGVNAHVVLEGPAPRRAARPKAVLPQDSELFVFGAADPAHLLASLDGLRDRAGSLSFGELTDAAAMTARTAEPRAPFRAAVVARSPEELRLALERAIGAFSEHQPVAVEAPPRVGLLFPGQSAPSRPSGGAWTRRFPQDRDLIYALPDKAAESDTATEGAQPAIVAASLIGIRALDRFAVCADAAAGHSLGELCALAWSGALDEAACLGLSTARGAAMAAHGVPGGGMARIPFGAAEAGNLASRYGLVVACLNGAKETVLAGRQGDIARAIAAEGGEALRVSHAFHSPDMAEVASAYRGILDDTMFGALERPVVSTVTGTWLDERADLRAVLLDQLTQPVRFTEALSKLSDHADLLIEVGPGAGLTRLATDAGVACLALDACAPTLQPMLSTLAELWRRGARLDLAPLFSDRPVRPLSKRSPQLLSNPCGLVSGTDDRSAPPVAARRALDAYPTPEVETAGDALAIVREAVADELGLPLESVAVDAQLLDDLHLNSLSVGRIVAAAAARLGLASPAAVMDLSNVTSAEIAAHLTELRDLGHAGPALEERVEGVAPWVAEFETIWELAEMPKPGDAPTRWRYFGADLPAEARSLPIAEDGTGALVVIGSERYGANSTDAALELWRQVKAARASGAEDIAVVHRGAGIEGFMRSLVADDAFRTATLIDIAARPDGWSEVGRLLRAAPHGVASWRLAPGTGLLRSALARMESPNGSAPAFGPNDVALVVGGAHGIGAECALRLAANHGVSLTIVGRSPPDAPAVAETIARAEDFGVRVAYRQADASMPECLEAAVVSLREAGFIPTLALHAAGVNQPARFDDLREEDVRKALAPKLDGLEALLGVLPPNGLKLVLGFGSIIGSLGLAGETHYALANGMMAERLALWGKVTGVRALALDWSVWAGTGMGERLGAVERLRQSGVDAIPLDAALARFDLLVSDPQATGRRIVTSRFGPPPQIRFAKSDPPPLRFIESPQVHFPGVELVADAVLSLGSDPWLEDHVVDGAWVVPGVMLLEAAAQAALTLTGRAAAGFEDIRFERAVSVVGAMETLRTAALHEADGRVRVILRASGDGFAADRAQMTVLTRSADVAGDIEPTVSLGDWPASELYGVLFFNEGRFRRIAALEAVSAFAARVRLAAPGMDPWFGPFLPQDLVLGDAGARDAGLHALQACAPQRRVLPVLASRIVLFDRDAPRALVEARETWSDGERFRFDIAWRDPEGRLAEIWQGAEFQALSIRSLAPLPLWAMPAALERAAVTVARRRDLRVALETKGPRSGRRAAALARLGLRDINRRGDGAPELKEGGKVSLSHGGQAVLAAVGTDSLGVDLVDAGATCGASLRSMDLALAEEIAAQPDWNEQAAAAAIWAAREALRKVGAPLPGQLHVELGSKTGGVLLRSEGYRVICLGCGDDGCAALALPVGSTAAAKAETISSRPAASVATTA